MTDTAQQTGIANATTKVKAGGYSDVEQGILRQEGIVAKGFWYARNNVPVKREQIDKILQSNPNTVIIQKLDLIDGSLVRVQAAVLALKNSLDAQLDFEKKRLQDQEVEQQEQSLKTAPTRNDIEKVTSKDTSISGNAVGNALMLLSPFISI